jgi:DNA-binding MarR family transcriptional regulator
MLILNDQLGFNINRVAILFRRELIRCFKEYEITPEQWQVLASLWEFKLLNQKQIIDLTLQDAPSVSKMIDRMKKNGLIQINRSTKDKRIKEIQLTKKGKAYQNELPKKLIQHFEELLSSYPIESRKELLNLLIQLRKILSDL